MIHLTSQYWAGPISNIVIVLGAILLLYPILKRLSLEQLQASLKAIETAKKFPDAIAKLNDFSSEMDRIEASFKKLDERLKILSEIDSRLEMIGRRIGDLQKAEEAAAPVEAGLVSNVSRDPNAWSDTENWEFISSGWLRIKEFVENEIDEITDQRVANKYNSLSRFDYGPVGEKLVADRRLTNEQASALKNAHDLFRSIKNRRTRVTPELKHEFMGYSDAIFASSV